MAGYDMFLPDTATRQKMLQQAEMFAPSMEEILGYTNQYRTRGKQALQDYFGTAQADIGAQFNPAMRLATARLGANPLLGDSGYANRLNRQLQTAAFGDLSRRYGQAAAGQSEGELGMLQQLINARLGAKQNYLQGVMGGAKKKKGFWDTMGGFAGSYLGNMRLDPGQAAGMAG